MKDPLQDPINNYDPDRLIRDNEILPGAGHPIRYFGNVVKISLMETFIHFFRTGKWCRTRRNFTPVCFGEPGYESAPYEANWFFHR